jgi:flagellar protein FliO/FliZ
MPSFVPMFLALALVLGLLGASAWLARRTGLAPRNAGNALRVVSQLALGPRERVVLVEAGDRWFLLGVGAGGVRRLGTLAREPTAGASGAPAQPAPAPGFASLFARLRGADGAGGAGSPQ